MHKTSLQVFRQTLEKNCVTGLGAADMRVGGMFGHSGRQRRLLSPRFLSRSSNPDELPSSSQSLGNPLPYADTARVFARQFFNRRWLIGLRCLHVRGGVMSVGHVSEVTRRRARLVLSWVTVLGYYINLYSPKNGSTQKHSSVSTNANNTKTATKSVTVVDTWNWSINKISYKTPPNLVIYYTLFINTSTCNAQGFRGFRM